jgi:AraC-like DNA-binding protein
MSTLHSSLYAVALLSCLLLLLIGRETLRHMRPRARYLLALLGLTALNFAFEWLMANPSTPAKSLWLTLVMGMAFLFGPCLWLYARSIDEPATPRLRDLPRSHLVVLGFGLLLLFPLLERTHLGTDFSPPGHVPNRVRALWVHGTMLAAVLVFALQAGWYLRGSVAILKRHTRVAKALVSDLEDRELNALRLMILVVGAHWVVGIARTLHCLILGKDAGFIVLFAISEVMITLWAMTELMRSTLSKRVDDRKLANELAVEPLESKYARSALDAPARARIKRKLDEAWNTQRLHLDSQLTLRLLCERLHENPHYVSQVINQDLGTSFYDLVNRQRIRDAMDGLLRQPDRPVIEIALEVGFNSKSTFNAAFRVHAGTTPTHFRHTRLKKGEATSEPAG